MGRQQRSRQERRLSVGSWEVAVCRSPPALLCQRDPTCTALLQSSQSLHSCQIPVEICKKNHDSEAMPTRTKMGRASTGEQKREWTGQEYVHMHPWMHPWEKCYCLLVVGCLTSQQQASVSQGRICSDNFTCCHTEIEVADQTFYLTQSQHTNTEPTSPNANPISPGAWQGSHWSANV